MTAFVVAETIQWLLIVLSAGLLFRIVMWMGLYDLDALDKRIRDIERRHIGDGK